MSIETGPDFGGNQEIGNNPPKFIASEKELSLNPEWVKAHPEYEQEKIQRVKEENEKWKKSLEIPLEIKPGTVDMLCHTMNRQIKVNNKSMERYQYEGKSTKQLEDATGKLEGEFSLLNDVLDRKANRMSFDKEKDGEEVSIADAHRYIADHSAIDIVEDVQKLIDDLENIESEGKEQIEWVIGNHREKYETKKLLKSLRNLQTRLINEGVRFEG